ncbi:copper chaperone PCu(A)C [Luteimonas abyssi]|uniref:copper chaperone PCu(A)C n=1 Tax=Luteimonas abyssi TaxID=1247514 RepID=UPI000737C753|nr:copper chaperone PCu(A)C [Luteimonas abyssi]
MTLRTLSSALLAALLLSACGQASHEAHDGHDAPASANAPPGASEAMPAAGVSVEQPWVRLPPPPAAVAAGYMTLVGGDRDDHLIAVETAAAERVEIHEMRETDGVMQMRELTDGLPLSAGARVALAPGGYHLMLIAPDAGLAPGARLDATLVFERAGRVPAVFEVRSATGQPADAHEHVH